MKKITFLPLLLTAMVAGAKPVTPQQANEVAAKFFLSAGKTNVALTPAKKVKNSGGAAMATPYYIFNADNSKGFVIISGDDRGARILGYSESGSLDTDNLPPQLSWLLSCHADKISSLPEDTPAHKSWSETSQKVATRSVLLKTAEWGQDYPYNVECPTFGDRQAPTGCVATAMAIMMKYNRWPESYDWDSMPDTKPENPIADLSRLMSDAGKAVYMAYGPEESGAQMAWVGNKLQSVFNYSPDCQFQYSERFSQTEWKEMLRGNLDKGQPVIYSGEGTGSHAFIIDGYEDDTYHINWGWNGNANGYFALNELKPEGSSDFSYNTGMVMNIVPNKSGVEYSECFVDYNLWAGGNVAEPMNISVVDVKKNEPFHIIQGSVTIPEDYIGEVGMALVGADNKIKEILKTEEVTGVSTPLAARFKFIDLKVTSDIAPDDKIQLVAKKENEDFKLVRGTLTSPSFVSVSNNTPRFGSVKVNLGEGVRMSCSTESELDEALGLGNLTPGVKEVKVLKGLIFDYYCTRLMPGGSSEMVLTVGGGPLAYGDIIMAGEFIGYRFEVAGDYEMNVKIVPLQDYTFRLEQAGTLKEMIAPEDANGVRNLTLSGNINFNDLMYIRDNMPCVYNLNMKDATIEACTTFDKKFSTREKDYPANTMPDFGLVNLHRAYIKWITLPENLTAIGSDSMVGFDIEQISIPVGVTSIGLNAFYGNHSLREVEVLNPKPVRINDCVFVDTPCEAGGSFYEGGGTLYVPEGSASKYRMTPVWSDFNIVEGRMESGIKEIPTEAAADRYDVFMADGKSVLIGVSEDAFVSLEPGIYVVRKGADTFKIFVP